MLWDQFVYEIWSHFWDQGLGSGIGNIEVLYQSAAIPNSWYQLLLSVTCWLLHWQFWESAFIHCPFISGILDLFPSRLPQPSIVFLQLCLHILYLHGNCRRWWTSSLAEDILPTLASASLIHHQSDRNTYRMNWQLFSLQLHWL